MRPAPSKWGSIGIILSIGLIVAVALASPVQRVAISFDDYHGYSGSSDYLKKVAASYPDITALVEIGKTYQDRSIAVLVVSNLKTGTTIDKQVQLRNMRKEPNTQNVVPMKSYQGKPGIWIDGGTHGNEFTGTEVCLYIIDKLVSNYGSDAEITRLVDDNVFYICPVVNPDGVFRSVEGGMSQRQNSPARDESAAVQAETGAPRDLNGDGVISQFRYKDPSGRFVQYEADPRVMVGLAANESTSKEKYSVLVEGQTRPSAGSLPNGTPVPRPTTASQMPSAPRGIDVNRNFPEGWFRDDGFQGGSGYYPSSSPEAHAILEFFTNHTNILMVQSFHTSGGFTYRPYARWPDSRMDAKDMAVYDRIMGKKYLELIGEEIPEAWKAPVADAEQSAAVSAGAPGRGSAGTQGARGRGAAGMQDAQSRPAARPAAAAARGPQGWRHPYNEDQRTPYGYGVFLDWAYGEFGSYAVSTELWNWQKDSKALPGYAGENDRGLWESAYIKYQETQLGGRAFIPWKSYDYPGVGPGEIGGWVAKYGAGNAIPGTSLTALCDTHWRFELFRAKLLPRLEISDAKATVLYTADNASDAKVEQQGDTFTIKKGKPVGRYKVVQVTATVKNTGDLATHVARGAQLAGNREDVIWLIGDRDKVHFIQGSPWTRLGVLEGSTPVPGYAAPVSAEAQAGGRGRGGAPPGPGAPLQARRPMPETPQVKGTGNTREISWLISVEGDTPLKLVLTSQKGGTKVRELKAN
jgi:hypothetical protein